MTYIVEVEHGTEVHACPVVNLYDCFGKSTDDPSRAVSGVIRLPTQQFLDFDASLTSVFTVH